MANDEWWRHSVIYQVYPRSFQDSDGDGIGDIPGITRRLDHIASLGVDVIWLSPFFKSPMADMGYDISDQREVDPLFGSLQDFDTLLKEVHKRDLKLIIDQVPSHVSDRHAWFEESRASRDNARADWFVWAEPKSDGLPPNNWQSVFGGPAWTWEPRRRQYYLHNFLSTQPQVNFHNQMVQDAVLADMRFWLERGVDGFRLDSINYPFHDAKLRDNPAKSNPSDGDWVNPYNVQDHIYDKTRPETPKFLERVRALCDEFPGTMTVGEVGEGGAYAARIMGEYTQPGRLNMAYSFALLGEDFTAKHFKDCVGGFFDHANGGWPCWAFSNHDVVRHATRWAKQPGDSEKIARMALPLLLSFEGAACLYQGEEMGQTETELTFDELTDPPGIKFWPEYKGRDGCRTPMTWEADAPNAGFTEGEPWLPVKPPQTAHSVDRQEADASSVLHHYRDVLKFYAASPLTGTTGIAFIDVGEPVLAFSRGDEMTCVFNLSGEAQEVGLTGNSTLEGPSNASLQDGRLSLPPFGYAWLSGAPTLGAA